MDKYSMTHSGLRTAFIHAFLIFCVIILIVIFEHYFFQPKGEDLISFSSVEKSIYLGIEYLNNLAKFMIAWASASIGFVVFIVREYFKSGTILSMYFRLASFISLIFALISIFGGTMTVQLIAYNLGNGINPFGDPNIILSGRLQYICLLISIFVITLATWHEVNTRSKE